MKKVSIFLILLIIFGAPIRNSAVSFSNISKDANYASTSLTVHNTSTNTTIYSVTIELTNLPGGTYTYSTNIPPGTTASVDLVGLANISQYVTLTLALSHNRDGALKDWRYDPYDDIYTAMGCQNFSHTTAPSLYFYLYSYNHLYLDPIQSC